MAGIIIRFSAVMAIYNNISLFFFWPCRVNLEHTERWKEEILIDHQHLFDEVQRLCRARVR